MQYCNAELNYKLLSHNILHSRTIRKVSSNEYMCNGGINFGVRECIGT